MLPAQQRIRTAEGFSTIIKNGVKVVQPGAIVYLCPHTSNATVAMQSSGSDIALDSFAPSADGYQPAAGFIVSKAIGNAVQRNKVKRRFRACLQEKFRVDSSFDVVVRARPRAAQCSYDELAMHIDTAFEKAKKKLNSQQTKSDAEHNREVAS